MVQTDDNVTDLWRTGTELLAGGLAGTAGILFGLPWDMVKVRMQVQPELYTGGMQCFLKTVRQDGVLSLYRGMMAPVLSQMPINAALFASEEAAMRFLEPNVPPEKQSQSSHVLAGMFSGFVSCFVVVPFDRVKCLVQADGAAATSGVRQYKGTLDCAAKVLKAEGPSGFFKGFGVTSIREVPSLGIYFTIYKHMSELLHSLKSEFFPATAGTLLAGGCAGASSWIVVYPFDVIKTTIQTGGGQGTTIVSVATGLLKQHGPGVFFRGLSPTIARAFPVNGITFLGYEKLKKLFGHDGSRL